MAQRVGMLQVAAADTDLLDQLEGSSRRINLRAPLVAPERLVQVQVEYRLRPAERGSRVEQACVQ